MYKAANKILLYAILSLIIWSFQIIDDNIVWEEGTKLCFDNFQASIPTNIDLEAQSSVSIYRRFWYRGQFLHFKVFAFFTPNESWIKYKSKTLLEHEQFHFDLAEITARKMRKYLAGLNNSYVVKGFVITNLQNIYNEYLVLQNKYDKQTKHSLDKKQPQRWEVDISDSLDAMKQFVKIEDSVWINGYQ